VQQLDAQLGIAPQASWHASRHREHESATHWFCGLQQLPWPQPTPQKDPQPLSPHCLPAQSGTQIE